LFDKSGLGRNAVATGNVYYTSTGISSRPSLRLVPDAFYSGTITPRMTGTTLYTFLVFSGDVGSDIWGRIISMGSNNTETFNIGRSNGSANTITSYRYTAANVNTTYLFTSTTVGDIPNGACITAIYDGTTTGQLRVNGISYTSATATDFNSSLNIANYVIGKHVSSLGNPFTSRWQGFLSEVLVYSTLTLDQVASVEAYLKRKWNV